MGILYLTGGIINIINIIRIIIITTIIITSIATIIVLSEVLLMLCLDQCLQKFINKTLQGGKRLLFNSDPWPPAEQKLEMPCDISGAQCGDRGSKSEFC